MCHVGESKVNANTVWVLTYRPLGVRCVNTACFVQNCIRVVCGKGEERWRPSSLIRTWFALRMRAPNAASKCIVEQLTANCVEAGQGSDTEVHSQEAHSHTSDWLARHCLKKHPDSVWAVPANTLRSVPAVSHRGVSPVA